MKALLVHLIIVFIVIHTATTGKAQHQLSQGREEQLYARGADLITHKNYGAARHVFTEFLNAVSVTDSRRGEATYYVAYCALNLGHTDGEKLIEQFMTSYPAHPRASTAYFDLAAFFYEGKNYTKAVSYYKKVNFPSLTYAQQSEAHFQWGYSYFNLKKLEEALEQFNFVKQQSNVYAPAANYYAGFIEYTQGNYEDALLDLKKSESNASYATVVPYLIANVYYKQQRYDDLIQYGLSLKGRADIANAAEVSMLIAEAYYFKGDYKNAAEAYEKFLADNPDKGGSALLFRAGYANYILKQDVKAVNYLSKAAATKDSTSFYASYYLGILYLKQGEKPLALNAFDLARKYPQDKRLTEESTFQFAKVLYDAGKPDQAITELEQFLVTYPASAHTNEVKELLAQAYVNGNNFHKAIEYIEALPKRSAYLDQAYQKATYLKGAELFNKEDYAGAVQNFEKSLLYKNDPGFVALAAFWAGEAYSIGKKFDEAIKHYQTVVQLGESADPEILIKTRYGLGYAHFNKQEYDRALFNFKEFVNKSNKSTANYADGLIRLADCYYVSKQYSEALSYYDRGHTIGSPDNDYVLLQKAMISGIQGKYADARTNFTALIEHYPKSQYRDEALYQRAQFEIEQGNYSVAVEGLTLFINEGSGSRFLPYAYMRRAASYFNLKQYEKTVQDYATIIQQFQNHPAAQEALLPLQEALNISGRSGEFEDYLAQFKKANPENKGLESLEFETAKNLYFDQQYQKAIISLKGFLGSYPQSSRTAETKYYIAESYHRLRDFENAMQLYTELSQDMTFTMMNRVVARQGEIAFKQGKHEQAVTHFHRLEKLASNKKELYTAWSGLMESFYLLAQYDSADAFSRLIIEKGNVNAGAQNKASLYLGKTAFARGDYETAKDEFLNTLNTAQDEYGAEAKYLLAQIFYAKKEHKQCYETLISLNHDFAAYEEWVGKSFLLLADNFIEMNDIFQAKMTLQSLIDKFPLEPIKAEAKKKLKEIEEREAQKQQKIAADTVDESH